VSLEDAPITLERTEPAETHEIFIHSGGHLIGLGQFGVAPNRREAQDESRQYPSRPFLAKVEGK